MAGRLASRQPLRAVGVWRMTINGSLAVRSTCGSDFGHPCPGVLSEALPVPVAPILGDSLENDVLIGNLEPLLFDRRPVALKGMQQRGQIIRAFARTPSMILYFGYTTCDTH